MPNNQSNKKSDDSCFDELKEMATLYDHKTLAKALDVTERSVYNYLGTGKQKPYRETVKKIHELFKRFQRGEDLKNPEPTTVQDWEKEYYILLGKLTERDSRITELQQDLKKMMDVQKRHDRSLGALVKMLSLALTFQQKDHSIAADVVKEFRANDILEIQDR